MGTRRRPGHKGFQKGIFLLSLKTNGKLLNGFKQCIDMITLAATAGWRPEGHLMETNVVLVMREAVETVEGSELRNRT